MMAESKLSIGDISHLTDEKLREALEGFGETVGPITPSTRQLLENQLKRKLEGNPIKEAQDTVDSGAVFSEKNVKVFSDESLNYKPAAQVFFGIKIPDNVDVSNDPDFQQVYTDKPACLAVLKKYKGSRFKSFKSYEEALQFAAADPTVGSQSTTSGEDGGTWSSVGGEKPSPFRGPKPHDLIKLKKAIEAGDMKYFNQCIEENPRYLVSSGDTPTILHEGSRYNAVHVACQKNRPTFVSKVLTTVAQPEFFQKLYPDDILESSERRSSHLFDLYLNTPVKGLNETPLHFASKFGWVECVHLLTTFPACKKTLRNKYDERPVDIVCSRMKEKSEEVAKEICFLLGEQYFVPLLRDDDHCLLPKIGSPWSPNLESPSRSTVQDQLFATCHSPVSPASPISPSFKVHGYAGPMSPSQAEAFHRQWRTSATSSPRKCCRDPVASPRLTDQEKGLERVGRELAADKGVEWTEYWDFLGDFANLTADDGITKLESHLRAQYKEQMMKQDVVDSSVLTSRLAEEQKTLPDVQENPSPKIEDCSPKQLDLSVATQSSTSTMSDLCQDLEALRLNASLSPQDDYIHPNIVSASSKFLESWKCKDDIPDNEQRELTNNRETEQETSNQEMTYIVKSVDVAAHRLAEAMADFAQDLQSSTVAKLSVPKTLRTKLMPEIKCLSNVVSKCCTRNYVDYKFIHNVLASKTAKYIQQNLLPSDLCVLHETVKIFVSHLNFVRLNSSDEEDSGGPDVNRGKPNYSQHFSCVLQCLEKALDFAYRYNDSCSDSDVVDKENALKQLHVCNCHWQINTTQKITQLSTPNSTPVNPTKYKEAHRFLSEALFSGCRQTINNSYHYDDSSVNKRLSFSEEDEGQTLKDTMNKKSRTNGTKNSVTCVKDNNDGGSCLNSTVSLPDDDDNDSFATAASSVDDLMLTPTEGLELYINGLEASKMDADVLAAIGTREIDEKKYPHVFQWHHLVSSFTEDQRHSWASPYSRRIRHCSAPNSAPSKLSHPSTPVGRSNMWIPSSTPRVLFPKGLNDQDASPF